MTFREKLEQRLAEGIANPNKPLPPTPQPFRQNTDKPVDPFVSRQEALAKKRRESRVFNKEVWNREYQKYLQSEVWLLKRGRVLTRDGYLCQSCLINRATEVHHTTYKNVDFEGNEPCFDLVSVCECCHEQLHDKHIKI